MPVASSRPALLHNFAYSWSNAPYEKRVPRLERKSLLVGSALRALPHQPLRATQPICIAVLALWPSHVTTTVPLPGRVDGPMDQLHDAIPLESAVFEFKPWAVDLVPAGVVYAMEHEAPGCVCATTRALPPGLAPVTDVICTPVLGCDCSVGAGVGATLAGARCGIPRYTSSQLFATACCASCRERAPEQI